MSARKSIKLVNMTSTQIFKIQAENIFKKLRHEATDDGTITFSPTHMGGLAGQRSILESKSIMRETTVDSL